MRSLILAIAASIGVAAPALAQAPETKSVKITLDWAFQGPQSVFLYGVEHGEFRRRGIEAQVDRGTGSSDTLVRVASGADQVMLDKENVRQWLIREKGFSGHGPLPVIPEDVRIKTADLYLGTFEEITGTPLKPVVGDVEDRIQKNLQRHGYL